MTTDEIQGIQEQLQTLTRRANAAEEGWRQAERRNAVLSANNTAWARQCEMLADRLLDRTANRGRR